VIARDEQYYRNVAHRAEAVTASAAETAVFSAPSYRNARFGVGKCMFSL